MNRVFTLFMCLYFGLVSTGGFAADVNLVVASPMLAKSPWPKLMGPGLHNTGRSPYVGPDYPGEKWIFDLGGTTHFRSPSIDTDGTIYAGSETVLFALNPDGSTKWSAYIPSEMLNHVTISEDDFLYVQTSYHKMYKIDSATGNRVNENWPYDFSKFPYTNGVYAATIANDGTILCGTGGSPYGYLHAINPDGNEKWKVSCDDNVQTLPAVDEVNNVVYTGNNCNQVLKVDLVNGNIIEQASPGGHGYITTHIAIGDNGLIYFTKYTDVGDKKGYIYAYDSDLNEKWRTQLGSYWVVPPAIGYDGTIYTAGRSTKKLTALEPSTGIEKWSFSLDSDFNIPPVIDANGTVYVVTTNFLYAIIPYETHAELKWSYQLEGTGYSQPAIGEDGTLYFVTENGILTALGISNSPPEVSPSGGGVYEINTEVILGGYVSDLDGDLLDYQWMEGTNVLFSGAIQTIDGGALVELPNHSISTLSPGVHTITLQADDGFNEPVSGEITVEIVDETSPTLDPAANMTILWPANHKMVDIVIEANASDNSGLPITLSASISSNEPINGTGDGDHSPDWTEPVIDQENGIITFQLRAERSGKGDGRVYTITITASDTSNNSTTANVAITVPHDKKKK